MPVIRSTDVMAYGPEETGSRPYPAPVSASMGTGLLEGSAMTNGRSG
jgi:hypothetical protein